jgi:hypothetical protein
MPVITKKGRLYLATKIRGVSNNTKKLAQGTDFIVDNSEVKIQSLLKQMRFNSNGYGLRVKSSLMDIKVFLQSISGPFDFEIGYIPDDIFCSSKVTGLPVMRSEMLNKHANTIISWHLTGAPGTQYVGLNLTILFSETLKQFENAYNIIADNPDEHKVHYVEHLVTFNIKV